jgi:hypothetical protein
MHLAVCYDLICFHCSVRVDIVALSKEWLIYGNESMPLQRRFDLQGDV